MSRRDRRQPKPDPAGESSVAPPAISPREVVLTPLFSPPPKVARALRRIHAGLTYEIGDLIPEKVALELTEGTEYERTDDDRHGK